MEVRASNSLVFGELEFPSTEWRIHLMDRFHALLEFDQQADEELLQLDIMPTKLRLRAWLLGPSFQSWCPRLEALVAASARCGATGEVVFAGVQRAYRMIIANNRVRMERAPLPGNEHPAIVEIALLVENRVARVHQARNPTTIKPAMFDLSQLAAPYEAVKKPTTH